MKLQFMEQPALHPALMTCPRCGGTGRIGIHSYPERRYRCHACGRTFAESQGTAFFGLHYPIWVVVLVDTLLAFGCPVAAIVAAFYLDERTVLSWQRKASQHGQRVQAMMAQHHPVELGQVQPDELCVTTQHGKVWVATAVSVFSRLFLGGAVSPHRDYHLIDRLMDQIYQVAAAIPQTVLFAVDGFSAYPKAILKRFYTKRYTGKPGRPRHLPWPDLHIVQVVKSRRGRKLKEVARNLVYGSRDVAYSLIAATQVEGGMINTAYIERFNATLRARIGTLVRRTRSLARTVTRLETDLYWTGVVYNFCTRHDSLEGTPAMAVEWTDHIWSVRELLSFRPPTHRLHGVL
jgi:transposase-like protein